MRHFLIKIFVLTLFPISGGSIYAKTPETVETKKETHSIYKHLNLFGEVFERVRQLYVEEAESKELIEAAINGMLTSLDPHSSYLNEKNFKEMQVQTRGEFGGLGIEVTMDSGFVKVVSPIDGTPAARAGIKAGDYITHLNKDQVLGMTLQAAVGKMRGKMGDPITLTIQREGAKKPLKFTIKRDNIAIRAVRPREYNDIGYLRITTFNDHTFTDLKKNIEKIKKDLGGKVKGYVLDLRNNPGGLLDQAIKVSNAFLERGEIVSTRSKEHKDIKRHYAEAGDLAEGKPIVILINNGSASASEIVSGALKEHKRALLVGEKSFGKGSVQTIMRLNNSEGALRLTTARYYTPSGTSIQATGIEPNIYIAPGDINIKKGEEGLSEKNLPGYLENEKKRQTKEKNKKKNKSEKSENGVKYITEDNLQKDSQLKYAFDLMEAMPFMEDYFVNKNLQGEEKLKEISLEKKSDKNTMKPVNTN